MRIMGKKIWMGEKIWIISTSHGDGMGEKNLESHQRNQHVSREVIESKGPVSRGFHGDERRILHPLAMTNSSPW